jgi:hypothetical protein
VNKLIKTQAWDLNIFFEDLGRDDNGENQWAEVLSINPVLWTQYQDGSTDNDYKEIVWKTTFAEARYIRSQYPEEDYGDDWTTTMESFIQIAPPRIKATLEQFLMG